MTRVLIMSEDRTGGGLNQVIISATKHARTQRGSAPLEFSPPGTVDGRDRLLAKCSEYSLLRFRRSPRLDHIFYVIDARGAEDNASIVPPGLQVTSGPSWIERREELCACCRVAMTKRAQESTQNWELNKDGFHPHVLVWERESLLLPVLSDLGLGESEPDSQRRIRGATELVRSRLPRYSKRTDGAAFLKQISERVDLLEKVLACNESLKAIVDEMVAL